SRPGRRVTQCQARDLYRVGHRNVLQQICGDAMRSVFETTVAPTVLRTISRRIVADRQRRRAPQIAGIVIAQVERFPGPITARIIRPRRELVLATVDRPGKATALCRYLEAEG